MRRLAALLLLVGCIGSQDDPSQVHDLRVLGVQMDPPEIMLMPPKGVSCFGLFGALAEAFSGGGDGGTPMIPPAVFAYLQPVKMTWLIEDPDGGGRDINYEIRACASVSDLTCNGDAGYVQLASGTTQPGELHYSNVLATQSPTDGGGPLLLNVLNNDTYKGLGGIRVPVVIHVQAGEEEIFAQKLMVYSCQIFPDMKPNVQPKLPGITIRGEEWKEGVTKLIKGSDGPPRIEPMDFTMAEEDYVVPSFSLTEVHLHESWKVSYAATVGRFSPSTTGGTDFSGTTDLQITDWRPGNDGGIAEQDVDFWFIVRDGRGGESWLQRQAHYIP